MINVLMFIRSFFEKNDHVLNYSSHQKKMLRSYNIHFDFTILLYRTDVIKFHLNVIYLLNEK